MLNIFDWIIIIAPIDIITSIMEYLNPAEYDPVIILPKNSPDTQDCTKIAMPNNSKREFDSSCNVLFFAASVSSPAPKLVSESITNNVVKLVIPTSINPTNTYGFNISLFDFSIFRIFSEMLANVSKVFALPPPDEIISNKTLKLIKI